MDGPGNDRPRCGARTRTGGTCPTAPVRGRTRCRMHGGKSLMGSDHPNFTTGLRSRMLPTRLLAKYEQAMADPELLSIRGDVALLDTLLNDKLAAWAADEAGPNWTDVYAQIVHVNENFQTWEWTRAKVELEQLMAVVNQRRTEGELLDQIRSLVDQRARLAGQEHRRMLDLNQVLTVEQVIVLASAVASIVRDVVPDEATRKTVNARIMGVLSMPEHKSA
jgi:hypothetical protein